MRFPMYGIHRDGNGRIIQEGLIAVFLAGTVTPASIYTTLTSVTVVNSVTSGTDGAFLFFVDTNDYPKSQLFKMILSKTGYTSDTIDDINIMAQPHDYNLDQVTDKWIDAGLLGLVATVAAAGSDPTLIIVSDQLTISSALTIPSTVTLKKIGAGLIIKSSGATIAFNGHLEAEGQIFSGFVSGNIVFGAGSVREVYPEWWGAVGDDSTNNTVAIQVAITSALSVGIPVKFGVGIYRFTNLTLPDIAGLPHYILEGSGCPGLLTQSDPNVATLGGTVLKCTAVDGSDAITLNQTTSSHQPSVTIRDLLVQGPDSGATTKSGHGIMIKSVGWTVPVDFENVSACYFKGVGKAGIYLYNVEGAGSRNVTVNRNDIGLKLITATNANAWDNVVAQYNAHFGIVINGSVTNSFMGGLVQSNYLTGIYITGSEQINFVGIHLENNNTTHNALDHGVTIEGTTGVYNSQINFVGCRFAGDYDDIYLTGVVGGTTAYVNFLGCRSMATNSLNIHGVYVYRTRIFSELGGIITDTGTETSQPSTSAWQAWIPTLTGPYAVLSGYDFAKYVVIGKVCYFMFIADTRNLSGSSGSIRITLPVTPAVGVCVRMANIRVYDGAAWVESTELFEIPQDLNYMSIYKAAAGGSWVANETGIHINIQAWYDID